MTDRPPRLPRWPSRRLPLRWQLVVGNALILLGAVLVVMVGPVTVSYPINLGEIVTLVVGLVSVVTLNALLLGRALRPLSDLSAALHDLDTPGATLPILVRRDDEIGHVAAAYNTMLDRLDREREGTMRAAISAQEDERRWVARELHDEIGQGMTLLLLRLKVLADALPPEHRPAVQELASSARAVLDQVRTVSARLRPDVLENLGLTSALTALVREVGATTGIESTIDLPATPAHLDPEDDLVVYRVAQEALTNVVRHARATRVRLSLTGPPDVVLTVADDGTGIPGPAGTGIVGMRERARLVRGRLDIEATPGRGTVVTLRLDSREGVRRR